MRVLERFNVAHSWTLQPGDALYLPPRWAHHGVSCDSRCITYSIGFRAPSVPELISSFTKRLAETTPEDTRFEAPPLESLLSSQMSRGRIDSASVALAREAIRSALDASLNDDRAFAAWLGCELTKPRRRPSQLSSGGWDDLSTTDDTGLEYEVLEAIVVDEPLIAGAEAAPALRHAETAIFAFIEHPALGGDSQDAELKDGDKENDESAGESAGESGYSLFIDGEQVPVPREAERYVPLLCQSNRLSPEMLREPLRTCAPFRQLVAQLLRVDALYEELE